MGLADFKTGLKDFVRREPIYIWLVIFIAAVHLITLIPGVKEGAEGEPKAGPPLTDRAKLEKVIQEDSGLSAIAASITLAVAVFIMMGIFFDSLIITRASGGIGMLTRTRDLPEARWSIWDVLKVVILFVFFGYIMAIIGGLALSVFPRSYGGETAISIVTTTLMDLAAIGLVLYFVLYIHKHSLGDLGLTLKNLWRNISYGVLGYISVIPVLFVTLLATAFLLDLVNHTPEPQEVFKVFLEQDETPVLIYMSLFVAAAGPVMEEIFFRGFLYNALKKETSVGGAISVSAMLFSLPHAHLVGFVPILILGVFLAYLYEKTGSLIPSITVHVIHNLIMVSFMFFLKGVSAR
jgi:hypothetical protein